MLGNKGMAGLLEATRLTREGRLHEATALIQRVLQKGSVSPAAAAAADDIIDVTFRDVTDRAGRGQQRSTDTEARRSKPEIAAPNSRRAGSTADESQTSPRRSEAQAGQFIAGVYANHAGTRPYKLYIPSGHAGEHLPLVVMLHGCTQTPDDFANGTRMNQLAEERRCFVLYPQQTQEANRTRCWNWFKRSDQRRDRGEPAILAGMTREIVERHRIDAEKVYVAGLSAGGAMAAVMGMAYPELFAAVGIHSGLACASAHDLPSAFAAMRGAGARSPGAAAPSTSSAPLPPVIVFHGDRDKTVHPRNGEQVVAQSVGQGGAAGGAASAERGKAAGGRAYTRSIHRDAAGRVVAEHWLVHGGGHAWFGGSPRGSYTDPQGPDASREMLRFFSESGRKDAPAPVR